LRAWSFWGFGIKAGLISLAIITFFALLALLALLAIIILIILGGLIH
jgi:hypothetical protein